MCLCGFESGTLTLSEDEKKILAVKWGSIFFFENEIFTGFSFFSICLIVQQPEKSSCNFTLPLFFILSSNLLTFEINVGDKKEKCSKKLKRQNQKKSKKNTKKIPEKNILRIRCKDHNKIKYCNYISIPSLSTA